MKVGHRVPHKPAVMTRPRQIVRSMVRHWRRVVLVGFLGVVGGYGVTYALVSSGTSPTDRVTFLDDGRRIASLTYQNGEAGASRVLLVHGAPTDAGSWDTFVTSQAGAMEGLEIVAVDRLGSGNSARGAETSLGEQAQSLEPFITPGTVLVGHSYGGPVVLRAAAEFGDRLDGIVIVAGACDPYMQDAQWFRRLVDGAGALVPEPWHIANAELLALTDENLAMVGGLDSVRCPVVVVHGTWDPVCPHDGTIAYLQRALPNAASVEVVSIPRAGHNLHLHHTDEVAAAINSLTGRG